MRFVDRSAEHVRAMNERGLRITGAADFTVPAPACAPEDLRGPLGVTFLAVKSQDTEAALDVLVPLAGPETVVVSLQNGMNPPRIAARLGADAHARAPSSASARTGRARGTSSTAARATSGWASSTGA